MTFLSISCEPVCVGLAWAGSSHKRSKVQELADRPRVAGRCLVRKLRCSGFQFAHKTRDAVAGDFDSLPRDFLENSGSIK